MVSRRHRPIGNGATRWMANGENGLPGLEASTLVPGKRCVSTKSQGSVAIVAKDVADTSSGIAHAEFFINSNSVLI